MNILLLCEGDAETAHGSFSGSAKSLLDHLRKSGHQVRTADTELYGADRYLAALGTFRMNRRAWSTRFRLGGLPFLLRSRRAGRAIRRTGPVDAILQIGATFRPDGRGDTPYFLFCDSNIRMAERGRESGQSQAASLSLAQIEEIAARETEVYRRAQGIFTLSERLRRSFIEDFKIAPTRVHTAHAGPNFDPAEVPPRVEREGPPTILFVGVRFERKGGDLLLRAFRRVRQVIPGARLTIIGPRQLEVRDEGVDYLGFLRKDVPAEWDRLVEAYAGATVFCLPTRFEPFGIVFIEAMFFGLPCIGPDAWAIPEMVRDGETGFLCPPESEDCLTEKLLLLLQDTALARRMGESGRQYVHQRFTWDAVAGRVTGAMKAAMGQAP
jgi:glycosyltransferase involved in cell wall biosynthesis